jgi:hypothetical protein
MSSRIGAAWGVVTVVMLVSACGGGAPQRPAEAPASGGATEESAPATGGASAAGYPASAAPEQPSASTDIEAAGQAPGQRGQARQELARAEAQLEAARSDCSAACRALASMQRATEHLCALADESDDRRRCEEARKRLLAARDRVRSSCGECS